MRWMTFFAVAALAALARASDWYVDPVNGSDANAGTSSANAWRSITFAMAHAPSGAQTIHVAPGTCTAATGEVFPIFMQPDVALIGSGAGSTVIDGTGTSSSILLFATAAFSGPGYTQTSQVFALTLRNAAYGISSWSGGGGVGHHVADVTIEGMSVAGHDTYAYLDVSGVHGSANTLLERVTITSCDRGVQAEGGRIQLTLRDCRLRSNTQQGIYAINNLDWITLKLARCALTDNGGSGIRLTTGWIHQVFLQAEDCLIAGSTNSGFEGVNFNAAEFLRCTFTQNGSGVRNTSGISTCELRDSIVYGNSDDVVSSPSMSAYWVQGCDIGDGDYLGQNGNFSADPLFVDAAAHDFRLKWSSPCVDVALTAPAAEARDLDGHARDVDGNLDTNERADVGAFEFRPLELVGTAQLGTLLQWKLWGPQGNATTLYWTRSALAATPTSTPFGHLDLVPSLARIYRVTTVGASAPTVIQRSIPNAIALVGQTFAFQALTDNASAPSGKAYTNAFQFTVLP